MIGDIRGDEKQRMFERTDVVVAPSFTENFAIVVAEALAHGAAVIASTGTPWKEVERVGCGLWVANDPASVADAIIKINTMPIAEMGERGRRWMATRFFVGEMRVGNDRALQKSTDPERREAAGNGASDVRDRQYCAQDGRK